MDQIHNSIEAVLFESYYSGISTDPKHPYKLVTSQDREWFDYWLKKVKGYGLEIISVEYMEGSKLSTHKADAIIKKLQNKGMIPYISNKDLTIYGRSSKEAVKREIFTLISEAKLDRTLLEPHQYGATVLEYMGYKQVLHDIEDGLPDISQMRHYAGVCIWLRYDYEKPKKLLKWVNKLVENGIKVIFVAKFGVALKNYRGLKNLGIKIDTSHAIKTAIKYQDPMVGYEINPPMFSTSLKRIKVDNAKEMLVYSYSDNNTSTPVAITPWGGYVTTWPLLLLGIMSLF
jgi:hypothetical protein